MQLEFLIISTIAITLPSVISYRGGAPYSACSDLTPGHGYPAQQTRSPFVILVAKTQYIAGENIRVMIRGLCGRKFKGFLVEARRADPRFNTTQFIGTFDPVNGTRYECGLHGLTHITSDPVSSIMLNWTAPRQTTGHILIKGSFVENFQTYWMNVNSAIIYDQRSVSLSVPPSSLLTPYIPPCAEDLPQTTTMTPPTTTTIATTTTTTTTTTPAPITFTTTTTATMTMPPPQPTSTSKIWQPSVLQSTVWATTPFVPFHDPDHGMIRHPDFNTNTNIHVPANIATVRPVETSTEEMHRLMLNPGCGANRGCFSRCNSKGCDFHVSWRDLGDRMWFDVRSQAIEGASDQWIAIAFSGDTKMGHDSVIECVYTSGVFSAHLSYNQHYENTRIPSEPGYLEFKSGSLSNGYFQCEFTRKKKTADSLRIFHLEKDFYIIFAQGEASGDAILKHDAFPVASAHSIDLQKNEIVEPYNTDQLFIKIHGCFMAFAWMFCASIGIVISRFYKPLWPSTMICGRKVWYTLHRFLLGLLGILVIAAFVIIFVEVQGLSEINLQSIEKLHPVIGIIVTFLTIVNMCMGTCRPGYDSKHRAVFNWTHWCVGILDHLIAVVNIVLGVRLKKAGIHEYITYIMYTYAIYQFCIVILLEIVQCNSRVKERKQQTYMIYERRSTFYSSSRESAEDDVEPPGSFARRVILKIHVLIITAMTASVVAIIALS